MLLTFNIGAACELIENMASRGRETVKAHDVIELQKLPRKPARGKAGQPVCEPAGDVRDDRA